jgi:hypothetical protein
MSVDKDVLAALKETKYAKSDCPSKLEDRWKESKEDREYAAKLAKRDEAIAFAKYRKIRDERKAKGELK